LSASRPKAGWKVESQWDALRIAFRPYHSCIIIYARAGTRNQMDDTLVDQQRERGDFNDKVGPELAATLPPRVIYLVHDAAPVVTRHSDHVLILGLRDSTMIAEIKLAHPSFRAPLCAIIAYKCAG
jgi:hypothetical protein